MHGRPLKGSTALAGTLREGLVGLYGFERKLWVHCGLKYVQQVPKRTFYPPGTGDDKATIKPH